MTDSILKIYRDKNFKRIYLKPITDEKDLSWKAKGIHTYLITRPDGWEFNRQDIINRASDGKTAVKSGLKELEDKGYLQIENFQNSHGKWTSKWRVAEDTDMLEEQSVAENPGSENPRSDNKPLSSKEISSKENSSTTEQSSIMQRLSSDDPSELNAKDLIKLFNHYMKTIADIERTTTNWGKEGKVMKRLAEDYFDGPEIAVEYLKWVARNKDNAFEHTKSSWNNAGMLNKFIDEYKNWKKEKEKSEKLAEQIDAGAPNPDESVGSMKEARDIMG